MPQIFSFESLRTADLIVDAIYEGSSDGQLASEPISNLLPGCGNMGGFRLAGRGQDKNFVVLFTTGEDRDWPDRIDYNTGQFVYYGDNKSPGHELHETPRGGNVVLRRVFELLHSSPPNRSLIPPFFIFSKLPTPRSARAVQFKGLAVPGHPALSSTEDLVAVWKTTRSQRFQNYRSVFTVLDAAVIERAWLATLIAGGRSAEHSPAAWSEWLAAGRYRALTSEPTTVIRSVEQQTPDTPIKVEILSAVHSHFAESPVAFEAFAARIFQMQDRRVIIDEITKASVDGGRDAIGRYLLGLDHDPVYVDFALEAKCYAPPIHGAQPNTVGVREVSRLISRLRHRQFGVLVTTSVVARQAYEEVREDRHPIVFLSGKDIAEILIHNGYNTPDLVRALLMSEFPNV
jgi:Restriction endonuclease AspBHI N-terminal/Restriction endonuclease